MPTYQYTAKKRTGQTVNGALDADNEHAAAKALRDQGLWPLRIAAASGRVAVAPATPPPATANSQQAPAAAPLSAEATAPGVGVWTAGSVRLTDQASYFRQFATAVHSGMPLGRSLDLLAGQSPRLLARISAEAATTVQHGETLSVAFSRYGRIFSPLVLAMIRAGEIGGQLDTCLRQIATMLEQQHEMQQRIRRQTFYPKLMIVMASLIGLTTNLILIGIRQSPQAAIQCALHLYVPGFILLLLAGITIPRVLRGMGYAGGALDPLKLALPLFGNVTRQFAVARFARAFASLYRAGVALPEALGASADASGNRVFQQRLRLAIPAVQHGASMSATLEPMHLFPTMAMNMLRTGEETGNIDEMLDKVAEYAEGESEQAVKQAAMFIGPVFLILFGITVGIIVGRFYLGYFNSLFSLAGDG